MNMSQSTKSPQIILLDEDLTIMGFIDDFYSLIWTQNYYSLGFYELHCSKEYFELIKKSRYVYRSDSLYTGRIDFISFKNNMIKIAGGFLEKILSFRVDLSLQQYNNNANYIINEMVNNHCINNNPIQFLTNKNNIIESPKIVFESFGKSVLENIYKIGETNNISINIVVDLEKKQFIFNTFRGLDKTKNQKEHSWVILSENFENILSETYETSTDFPNFAFVYGEDKEIDRKNVTVNEIKENERRELFVDARDIRFDDKTTTQIQYLESLVQRGKEKLIENGKINLSTVEVEINDNMLYNLGDLVTYIPTYDKNEQSLQIVSIREVFEPNNIKKIIQLGKFNNIDNFNFRRYYG